MQLTPYEIKCWRKERTKALCFCFVGRGFSSVECRKAAFCWRRRWSVSDDIAATNFWWAIPSPLLFAFVLFIIRSEKPAPACEHCKCVATVEHVFYAFAPNAKTAGNNAFSVTLHLSCTLLYSSTLLMFSLFTWTVITIKIREIAKVGEETQESRAFVLLGKNFPAIIIIIIIGGRVALTSWVRVKKFRLFWFRKFARISRQICSVWEVQRCASGLKSRGALKPWLASLAVL